MKRRWWQRQRVWRPGGWWIMYSWRHAFAIGIYFGASWVALRVNGGELWLGPINLSIQPPPPKWLLEDDGTKPIQSIYQ